MLLSLTPKSKTKQKSENRVVTLQEDPQPDVMWGSRGAAASCAPYLKEASPCHKKDPTRAAAGPFKMARVTVSEMGSCPWFEAWAVVGLHLPPSDTSCFPSDSARVILEEALLAPFSSPPRPSFLSAPFSPLLCWDNSTVGRKNICLAVV